MATNRAFLLATPINHTYYRTRVNVTARAHDLNTCYRIRSDSTAHAAQSKGRPSKN